MKIVSTLIKNSSRTIDLHPDRINPRPTRFVPGKTNECRWRSHLSFNNSNVGACERWTYSTGAYRSSSSSSSLVATAVATVGVRTVTAQPHLGQSRGLRTTYYVPLYLPRQATHTTSSVPPLDATAAVYVPDTSLCTYVRTECRTAEQCGTRIGFCFFWFPG